MDFDTIKKIVLEELEEKSQLSLKDILDELSSSNDIAELYFIKSAMSKREFGGEFIDSLNLRLDEAIRTLLLLHTLKYIHNISSFLKEAYHIADTDEKITIIKVLDILDSNGYNEDEVLKELALLAKQTSNEAIFCALALNNSYISNSFDEQEFNSLVLKALHLDLDLNFLVGLEKRANKTLQILAKELCQERANANRPMPSSINLILGGIK